MDIISKWERKYGKYALKNLPIILIACYGFGYLIKLANPTFVNYLTLNPYLLVRGQVWRLITWMLIPPQESNVFFVFIMLFFYYSLGVSLERAWGTFRYNLYIFSGLFFTVLGALLCMGICYLFAGDVVEAYGAAYFFQVGSTYFSTYYVNMSIFLAFAATFPENRVYLFFILPVKVKWLGIIYGGLLAYNLIAGAGSTYTNIFYRTAIVFSLLNFGIYMLINRKGAPVSPKQMKRRAEFKRETQARPHVNKHKCAICGRTDESNPELEFRFCSKCNGNYEYCQDHLFTHQHVK